MSTARSAFIGRSRSIAAMSAAPAAIWLVVALLLPMLMMVVFSFWTSKLGGMSPIWTIDNYLRFFQTPIYPLLFAKSLKMALIVTALLLLIGYPAAYCLARFGSRYRTALLLLLLIPFWTSYLVRSFAWLPLLGKQGLLNEVLLGLGLLHEPSGAFLYNDFAVYVGLAYVFLPFMIIPIYLVLERQDLSLEEAAADQGASPWQVFWKITVPLSYSGISSGCILVFMNVIGNAVADQFSAVYNLPFGATLSVVLVISVLVFIFLITRLTRTSWIDVGGPK